MTKPVIAAAPTFGYQLRKLARRNKKYARAAAVVAGLLVVATVVSSYQWTRATREQHATEKALERAEQAEKEALNSQQEASKARDETQQQLELSLVEQARAWQLGKAPGYRTNVLHTLDMVDKNGWSSEQLADMRSIAWAAIANPFPMSYDSGPHPVPDEDHLVEVAHSESAFGFGYDNGMIRVIPFRSKRESDTKKARCDAGIIALSYHHKADLWLACDKSGVVTTWRETSSRLELTSSWILGVEPADDSHHLLPSNNGMALVSMGTSQVWIWDSLGEGGPRQIQLPCKLYDPDASGAGAYWISNAPIALHPDGHQVALLEIEYGNEKLPSSVWNLTTLKREALLGPVPKGLPVGVKFSRDGSRLLGGVWKYAYVRDTDDWGVIGVFAGDSNVAGPSADISGDGQWISIGLGDARIMDLDREKAGGRLWRFWCSCVFGRSKPRSRSIRLWQPFAVASKGNAFGRFRRGQID